MARTLLITIFTWTISIAIHGQSAPFSVAFDQDSYESISSGVPLAEGVVWDNLDETIPIGFTMEILGQTTDKLVMDARLDAAVISLNATDQNTSPLIFVFGADLVDRGTANGASASPISYQTQGPEGDRIFVLEFANAGFAKDSESGFSNYVNFQLKLFESSQSMEFHYGDSDIVNDPDLDLFDGSPGPLIGLTEAYNFETDELNGMWYFAGGSSSPTLLFTEGNAESQVRLPLLSTPPMNTIYRFSTGTTSRRQLEPLTGVTVFPSLINHEVNVDNHSGDQINMTLIDPLGRVVFDEKLLDAQFKSLDTTYLMPGVYYLHLHNSYKSTYRVLQKH